MTLTREQKRAFTCEVTAVQLGIPPLEARSVTSFDPRLSVPLVHFPEARDIVRQRWDERGGPHPDLFPTSREENHA